MAQAIRGSLATLRRRLRGPMPSFVREVIEEWQKDRAGGLGAEIAFFAVLSVFPALLAIAASLAFLDSLIGTELGSEVRVAVIGFLQDMLTADASEAIAAVGDLFTERNTALVSVATVGTVWVVSRGVFASIRALDVVYGLPEERSWIRTRTRSVVLAVGTILVFVVILVIVVTGPLLGAGDVLGRAIHLPSALIDLWLWLRYPLAAGLVLGWIGLLFQLGPNQGSPFRWELPGAVVTLVLWLVLSLGFRLYIGLVQEANQILGILGGALILMLWMYLLSLSLLVGAEVNDVLTRRRGDRWRPKEA